jgi:predicted dehydrogenase
MRRANKSDPLTLAFLGCGSVTRMHSKTLARSGIRIRRFYASQDPRRAQAYDGRFRGSGWFHSYQAAMENEEIQVVLVATPPSLHLDLTLRALEAGKHVIVEKPAFVRSADFDPVLEAMETSGRRVFVAENYFYKPLAERLRRVIRSGCLGDIRFVHLNALKGQSVDGWRADPSMAGGGALFEGGIHWVSLMGNLGLELVDIRGLRAGTGAGMERSALVVARYAQGAVGTLQYSWEVRAPLGGVRLSRIHGTEGAVLFESNGLFLFGRARGGSGNRRCSRLTLPGFRDLLGYRAMFQDFVTAIRRGSEPLYTLRLARTDIERVERIQRTMDGAGVEDLILQTRKEP